MNPVRLLLAIPVLPALGGWLRNRRKPTGRLCAPADVLFNVSDTFSSWVNRIPSGGQSHLIRDKDGRHVGSINRVP